MKKKIVIGTVALFLFLQIFQIDKINLPIDSSKDFIEITNPPDQIRDILKTACYDCHSHETKYPWYSNIAPVSWWVKDHINDAREELNFSEWGTYDLKKSNHKLDEMAEEVEEEGMPLTSYTLAHSEARLTGGQRKALVSWAKSQMKPEEK
ncbi:MAG: heme-binding domain-containing protein [Bacteroidetes bacterium]|nr:heme-binding domain-containing protein [Bacteroidota bacterium]MDA1119080.1 heme-binding domain-containing protein [Bacteroidota bacterium]